jgi:hypothetical protein
MVTINEDFSNQEIAEAREKLNQFFKEQEAVAPMDLENNNNAAVKKEEQINKLIDEIESLKEAQKKYTKFLTLHGMSDSVNRVVLNEGDSLHFSTNAFDLIYQVAKVDKEKPRITLVYDDSKIEEPIVKEYFTKNKNFPQEIKLEGKEAKTFGRITDETPNNQFYHPQISRKHFTLNWDDDEKLFMYTHLGMNPGKFFEAKYNGYDKKIGELTDKLNLLLDPKKQADEQASNKKDSVNLKPEKEEEEEEHKGIPEGKREIDDQIPGVGIAKDNSFIAKIEAAQAHKRKREDEKESESWASYLSKKIFGMSLSSIVSSVSSLSSVAEPEENEKPRTLEEFNRNTSKHLRAQLERDKAKKNENFLG